MAASRNLVILGTGPNQYLVQAEGSEEEVQAALQKMLPGISMQLGALAPKQAAAMLSRLSDSQHKAMASLSKSVNSSVSKNAKAFQLQIVGDQRLAAAANKNGVIKFDPQISKVRKPIGGGIGPVGITVGIGIAGKF
jgi:hypothetical protein